MPAFSSPNAAKATPQRIVLHGTYCTLEPLDDTTHGASLWAALAGHDAVWTYLPQEPWMNEESFRQWLKESQIRSDRIYFAVIDHHSNNALGCLCLMDINQDHGTIELGGVFFSPSLQKTTAATEAIYLLACYIFDELGYRRFQWRCNADNTASQKAAQRLGFIFEGLFRQHMIIKGHNRDTAWFSMLDNEWPPQKAAFQYWLDRGNFDENGKQKKKLEAFRE